MPRFGDVVVVRFFRFSDGISVRVTVVEGWEHVYCRRETVYGRVSISASAEYWNCGFHGLTSLRSLGRYVPGCRWRSS